MWGNPWNRASLRPITHNYEGLVLLPKRLIALADTLKTIKFALDHHFAILAAEYHQIQKLILIKIVFKLVLLYEKIFCLDIFLEVSIKVD
jgi:hypothetical protein